MKIALCEKTYLVRRAVAVRLMLFPVLALLYIAPLNAGVVSILYETRPYAGGNLPAAIDYVNNWNALVLANPLPPAGYGSGNVPAFTGLSNHTTFGGSTTDIGFHTLITLNLTPSEVGMWNMQFGIDYGFGGAMFVDGGLVDFRNTDMWWSGSFSNPTQILAGLVNLTAGSHSIELFGLEGCCDGATQGRYQIGTQPFVIFTAETAAPEPGTATMIVLVAGLLVLRLLARRHA